MKKIENAFNNFVKWLYTVNCFISFIIWCVIVASICALAIITSGTFIKEVVIFDLMFSIMFALLINHVMRLAASDDILNDKVLMLLEKAQTAKTAEELIEIKKQREEIYYNDNNTRKLVDIIDTRLRHEFKKIRQLRLTLTQS